MREAGAVVPGVRRVATVAAARVGAAWVVEGAGAGAWARAAVVAVEVGAGPGAARAVAGVAGAARAAVAAAAVVEAKGASFRRYLWEGCAGVPCWVAGGREMRSCRLAVCRRALAGGRLK